MHGKIFYFKKYPLPYPLPSPRYASIFRTGCRGDGGLSALAPANCPSI